MTKPKVLFLCLNNSARSQMAEGLLKILAGDRLEISSAGLEPKPVHPRAVAVLAEWSIDISHHQSKPVGDFLDRHFGYIITVCSDADRRCPSFPGIAKRFHWPVDDPAQATGTEEEKLTAFRRARDELKRRIVDWLEAERL